MKVINDLLGYDNLKIVQNPEWFSFSLDSVLLPNFVTLNKDVKNILDLGTGNAPIPMILSTLTEKATIYGIEIQKDVFEMAEESIKINNLNSRIKLINDDMKKLDQYFEANFFDVIVSNPPYIRTQEINELDIEVQQEPKTALDGGEDGLDFYRRIVEEGYEYLKLGSYLCLEIGYDQKIDVIEIIENSKKYEKINCKKDLYGNDRVITTRVR